MIAYPEGFRVHVEGTFPLPEIIEGFSVLDFPHLYVFLLLHRGKAFRSVSDLRHNAEVIAKFSVEGIKEATITDLLANGLIDTWNR